jgi:hypothetical protein
MLLVAGCGYTPSGEPRFCEANKEVCLFVGAVIVGGLIASNSNGADPTPAPAPAPLPSDSRLKTDVTRVGALDGGPSLYAYRYIGSDEMFVGVLAEDLLADSRYAHLVQRGDDGFLRVDYSGLPGTLLAYRAMRAAGERAAAL